MVRCVEIITKFEVDAAIRYRATDNFAANTFCDVLNLTSDFLTPKVAVYSAACT